MRDTSIDTLGGILIYFMVFRHCFIGSSLDLTFLGGCLSYYPLMFYMGWFFYKGGCYFHEASLSTTLEKGLRRLLIPYLCFSIIAICIEVFFHGLLEGSKGINLVISDIPVHLKREGAVSCNAPLWFLSSLFFVRIFYAYFIRIHIPVLVVAFISLLGSFFLYRADLPIGVYFENILIGLFFFCIGSLLNKKQYDGPIFIVSCIYFILFLFYAFVAQNIVCEFRVNSFTPYFPTILFSVSGCIVANNLFSKFPSLNNQLLASVGRNSMSYFATHFIIIRNLLYLNEQCFHLSPRLFFIITLFLVFALLPLIVRLFLKPQFRWMVSGPGESVLTVSINDCYSIIGISLILLLMTGYVLLRFFS